MSDQGFKPDDLPGQPASSGLSGQEVPQEDLPQSVHSNLSGQEVPPDDLPSNIPQKGSDVEEKYGTPEQQAIAGIEGITKGVIGRTATAAAEKYLFNTPEEAISGREEANPWTSGIGEAVGLGGSMISGVGEAALLGKVATAISEGARIGKVGQAALRLAIEGGAFHLDDNVSKMVLGQTDPEAPVASLLAGMPSALVLGAGLGAVGGKIGGKLEAMANSEKAKKAAQSLSDFGNRYEFRKANGDIATKATEEAQHLYDTVSAAVEGGFSLKRDSVEKLTRGIDPAKYVNDLHAKLTNVSKTLLGSELYQDAIEEWQSKAFPKPDLVGGQSYTPTAADVFDATDSLKRKLQHWASFEKRIDDPTKLPFVQKAAALSNLIRTSLEDSSTWGEMGNFQKELNGAYSKLQTPLKEFTSAAMSTKDGVKQVDPGKISNILKSTIKNKPGVGFKADKVADFFDPARDLLDAVDKLHAAQGIESSIPRVSTTTLDEMLRKDISPAARLADSFFDRGPGAVGWAAGHAVGTLAGKYFGDHPYLGYRAGEHLAPLLKSMGEKPTNWAVSAFLKSLSSGATEGIPEVMNYAKGIKNGASRIDNSINNLFLIGGKKYLNSDFSEKDRDKLDDLIKGGAQNQQIINQGQPPETRNFAHGGEVMAPELSAPTTEKVGTLTQGMGPLSVVYPQQAAMLTAAKTRINGYLNQLRPSEVKSGLPFDDHMPDKAHKKTYNKALDLANKPLSVLDHIKNGTLEPEHVQHMQGMYPELTGHLQKKISEKVLEAQIKNEKPPYHVRQSLSLFMGSALDSNLTPQNIQAAQATFLAKQMAQQQPAPGAQKPKRGTATLGKAANQYRTPDQAAQARQSAKG